MFFLYSSLNNFVQVDRGDFIKTCPYYDSPQPLGVSTATISAPHMHASALEALKDQLIPGNRALDVGETLRSIFTVTY